MKKFIIIIGALLLAAVFMSGCITAPESDDPVVGIWEMSGPGTIPEGGSLDSITFVVNADGTAYSLGNFAGDPVAEKFDYTWESTGDGKYRFSLMDSKETVTPDVIEYELRDGMLKDITLGFEFHRITLEEFAPGLWTGIRGDYNEYTDIQVLLYLGENSKGHTAIYGPEVLNMEDVFAAEFTWDVRENNVVLLGPNGGSFELSLVNGELVFAALYPLHKYTIEDHLYGLWQSAEPHVEDGVSYDIVEFIKSDGTGTEIWTVPGSDAASKKYTFTWKMIDSNTYEAVYDDGDVWQFKSINNQLFDGETWYNKVSFDVLQDYAQNKVTA